MTGALREVYFELWKKCWGKTIATAKRISQVWKWPKQFFFLAHLAPTPGILPLLDEKGDFTLIPEDEARYAMGKGEIDIVNLRVGFESAYMDVVLPRNEIWGEDFYINETLWVCAKILLGRYGLEVTHGTQVVVEMLEESDPQAKDWKIASERMKFLDPSHVWIEIELVSYPGRIKMVVESQGSCVKKISLITDCNITLSEYVTLGAVSELEPYDIFNSNTTDSAIYGLKLRRIRIIHNPFSGLEGVMATWLHRLEIDELIIGEPKEKAAGKVDKLDGIEHMFYSSKGMRQSSDISGGPLPANYVYIRLPIEYEKAVIYRSVAYLKEQIDAKKEWVEEKLAGLVDNKVVKLIGIEFKVTEETGEAVIRGADGNRIFEEEPGKNDLGQFVSDYIKALAAIEIG